MESITDILPKRGRGRPRAPRTLTEALVNRLNPKVLDELANVMIERALAGDMRTASDIMDRVEGRPRTMQVAERLEDSPLMQILQGVLDQDSKDVTNADFTELD